MARMSTYSATIIVLHWLIAVLIFFLTATGWYMVELTKGTPAVAYYYNLHKSVGLIVMALIALMISWRLRRGAPELPPGIPEWERRAADIGHWLLYILLVIVPLSGYIEANFAKWGIDFFGYELEPWGPENETIYNFFNRIHIYSSNIFAAVIALHILAAIKHMVSRTGVVYRMLPAAMQKDDK